MTNKYTCEFISNFDTSKNQYNKEVNIEWSKVWTLWLMVLATSLLSGE